MKAIEECIAKMEKKHKEHIAVYGADNEKRLTGRHETGHIDAFSSGVANRGASIRIPRQCAKDGFGYFEDRRPASNIGTFSHMNSANFTDPYQVTGRVVETLFGSI